MKPKYLLQKSDRRCALTQFADKKYDSVSFAIPLTLEQVWKQRLNRDREATLRLGGGGGTIIDSILGGGAQDTFSY